MERQYVLGVDIGGSHITAAALGLHDRQILEKSYTRKHLDALSTKETILKTWKNAIFETWTKAGLKETKIGIAMPGPFDYEAGISYMLDNNKFQALYELNVKEALAWELGIDPSDIVFNNDASCFLAGEVFGGVARNYKKILGITLGTGLGSSIYDHGIVRDANLWEMPFRNGIAEDYISSRWFLGRYEELTGKKIADVKTLCTLTEGKELVEEIFTEFSDALGSFLTAFQKKGNADAIVIGGNISKAADRFLAHVVDFMKSNGEEVPILISTFNEHAALVGAGSFWEKVNGESLLSSGGILGRH